MAYIIYENEGVHEGEVYHDKSALFNAIGYAEYDARVFEFDVSEAFRDGSTPFRDVSEEMVLEAHEKLGDFDGEHHRNLLPGRFITFPLTRDEAEATEADDWYDQRMSEFAA